MFPPRTSKSENVPFTVSIGISYHINEKYDIAKYSLKAYTLNVQIMRVFSFDLSTALQGNKFGECHKPKLTLFIHAALCQFANKIKSRGLKN